ncbi:MAG: hypothetical protein HY429_03030 [Candidatus Levybacteria bacterium]|nr:hypothetical protein [Candidatus Levybacteria bacterium]
MRKLLRPQDILLLGLSFGLDVFEELSDPLQIMGKSYETMYGWMPERYKRHNYYHLVWRNLKTANIEKIEKNGQVYLRLTPQGQKKAHRDFPLLSMQQAPWDRRWRIISFDIDETKRNARDYLREKLKDLGFAMLQESIFITPHDFAKDLAEFVESLGLKEYVYIFEASRIAMGNEKELARSLWKLDLLQNTYEEIAEKLKDVYLTLSRGRGNKLNTRQRNILAKLKHTYLQILLCDPLLPHKLLPSNWKGEKVKKLIALLGKYE